MLLYKVRGAGARGKQVGFRIARYIPVPYPDRIREPRLENPASFSLFLFNLILYRFPPQLPLSASFSISHPCQLNPRNAYRWHQREGTGGLSAFEFPNSD